METKKYSIGNSAFGLLHYPAQVGEWTMERKFQFTAQCGYEHFEGDFGREDRKKVKMWAEQAGLTVGCLRFGVRSVSDMARLIEEAHEANAAYIVAIAGKAYYSVEQSVDLVGRFMEMTAAAGLPFYLETHRDSVTQDLLRCTQMLEQLPALNLFLDLSHVLVAGEITEDLYEQSMPLLQPLFERAAGLHGRISNGNQIQINLEDVQDYNAQRFGILWAEAIKAWKSKPDTGRPFRFTLELGPPSYALTSRTREGLLEESKDRTQQGGMLVELFKQAWAAGK